MPGIYHMTAAGSTSWYGFARAIFEAGTLASPPGYNRFPPRTIQPLPGGLPIQCCPTKSSPGPSVSGCPTGKSNCTGNGRDANGQQT